MSSSTLASGAAVVVINLMVGLLLQCGSGSACCGYYFGFTTDTVRQKAAPQSSLSIISPNTTNPIPYEIEAVGLSYFTNGIITNKSTFVELDVSHILVKSCNDKSKGFHLMICSDEVTVIGQNMLPHSGDTFLSLPIVDQGDEHLVYFGISIPKHTGSEPGLNSTVLIIGVKNGTMINLTVTQPVTISVSNSTVDLTAGIQYSFVINRLQTVLIGSVDDLTGTKIVADNPVSVLSGHECGLVPFNLKNTCNHLIEQVPSTTLWGRVYYTAPLATRRSYTIKVLAAYNSTVVDIYCNNTKESYNIREGESVNKTLSLQEYCAIICSKEVLVVQFSHGFDDDENGDPMMTLVPAKNQYSNSFQSSTLQGRTGFAHYINIIVLAKYSQPDMIYLISGGVSRSLDTIQWAPIMVNGVIEAYGVYIMISEGAIDVIHDNPNASLSILSYGFCRHQAYGHPGKSNNKSAVDVQLHCDIISFNEDTASLNWKNPPNITVLLYKVYYTTTKRNIALSPISTKSTSYTLRDLSSGTKYSIYVTAVTCTGLRITSKTIVFTTLDLAYFQIRLYPVKECTEWTDDHRNEKLLSITEAIAEKLALYNYNISDEAFSCREFKSSVVYRAKILSNTSAEDIVNEIDQWVKSETSITVDQVILSVSPSCPAMLDSFESKDCVLLNQSSGSDGTSVGVIAGIVLGAVLGAVVVVVAFLMIIIKRRKKNTLAYNAFYFADRCQQPDNDQRQQSDEDDQHQQPDNDQRQQSDEDNQRQQPDESGEHQSMYKSLRGQSFHESMEHTVD